jgi:hypothetical protein
MKIFIIITVFFVVLAGVIVLFLSQHGLFHSIDIKEQSQGPFILVYEKNTGDYKLAGSLMDRVYYDLKDKYNIETTKGFGIYYDNPEKVDRISLRCIAGCIVETGKINDFGFLKEKYKTAELPASNAVTVSFPYNGKISVLLGVFKVYPKLSSYIEENKYPENPVMEIYDQPGGIIKYIAFNNIPGSFFEDVWNNN